MHGGVRGRELITPSYSIFSENLDSGACQVKNLKREKLSDFLGLTDIFSVKNVVTN
jgi:hypothetical protein